MRKLAFLFLLLALASESMAFPVRHRASDAPPLAIPAGALAGEWRGSLTIVQSGSRLYLDSPAKRGHGTITPDGKLIVFWEWIAEGWTAVGVYEIDSHRIIGHYVWTCCPWDIREGKLWGSGGLYCDGYKR